MADRTPGVDLVGGGKGGSRGEGDIPNIGAVSAQDVAPLEFSAPTADGEPVSPAVARVRYGAAAAQGYGGDGDPGSP